MWAVALTMLAVVAALPEGPTASLSVDDAFPLVGQTVHFNASASTGHDAGNGRIAAYNFSFGDGIGTGWQASPLAEHAYASSGAFVARVIVVDNRGGESAASVTIHPGTSPPPPAQAPDLVPIQAQLSPTAPRQNDSINVTVVVLNRGGSPATAANLTVYDVPENGSTILLGRVPLPSPVAVSQTVSAKAGPFLMTSAGNHTLRILVTDVTPAEMNSGNNELDVRMTVLPSVGPNPPGGGGAGGAGFAVSPLAVGLGVGGVAAGVGAGYLLLRPGSKPPLEPPPASPPDRSPPPIWPP